MVFNPFKDKVPNQTEIEEFVRHMQTRKNDARLQVKFDDLTQNWKSPVKDANGADVPLSQPVLAALNGVRQKSNFNEANETIKAINALLSTDKFSPADFSDEFKKLSNEQEANLKKQHSNELAALPTTTTPNERAAIEDAQKKQQESFSKELTDNANRLHQAAQQQREIDTFIAYIAAVNEKTRVQLENLARQNSTLDEPDQIVAGDKYAHLAILRHLSVAQITVFNTSTGKAVYQSNGVFSVNSRRLGFAIHDEDANAVALGVRASLMEKHKDKDPNDFTITINVHHEDPAQLEILAEKAYRASRLAGFGEKNITIEYDNPNQNQKGESVKKKYTPRAGLEPIKPLAEPYLPTKSNDDIKKAIAEERAQQKSAGVVLQPGPAAPPPAAGPKT